MPDTTITALTAAATPLDGTETLPGDKSGTTVKLTSVSIAAIALQNWTDLGILASTATITGSTSSLIRRKATLGLATTAITLTTSANQQIDLQLLQDGTGGRAATFTGVTTWATQSGSAPSLVGRAAGAIDRFSFENIGTVVTGYWLTETIAAADSLNNLWIPDASIRETYSRNGVTAANLPASLVSGRLHMRGIALKGGDIIDDITFLTGGTAAGTPTNQWAALFDYNRVMIRTSADQTTGAWAASTFKTFILSTPYTVPATAKFYVGLVVVATTVPTLAGIITTTVLGGRAPILTGFSDTGLTTPATCPATAATITATTGDPYVTVN